MSVVLGDMRKILLGLPDECVHSVVTDPPYGLEFMGKQWDGQVPGPEYWREALRVAKPGAYLLAFGGTRTAHRLACAIEDAGWEIRDCLMWLYGSGFPKSHDVSKAIDREQGAARELTREGVVTRNGYGDDWDTGSSSSRPRYDNPATPAAAQWNGWGTALKPAWEPIYLARKPLVGTVASNVLEYGTGAINVDACRIAATDKTPAPVGQYGGSAIGPTGHSGVRSNESDALGRWPANLCLDEQAAAALDEQTGVLKSGSLKPYTEKHDSATSYGFAREKAFTQEANSGGASRFFYVAKASRAEREAGLNGNGARANTHPTVKPIALMRWLVRLITPPGGIVLDPFAGSGSTGIAAKAEGFIFLGCEIEPAYARLANLRLQ